MKNRHFVLIIIIFILLGLLLIWHAGRPKPERNVMVKPTVRTDPESGEREQRDMTLYFSSEDGAYLVSEVRQLGCGDEANCIRALVEALVSGPVQDGSAVLPARTKLLGVQVDEGTATLDFSSVISTGHPGGSQSELLTVYALANSVAVNFPHLRQVILLIDGQPAETLKGHVDLRRPLIADFTFARPPAGEGSAALTGDGTGQEAGR